MTGRGFPASIAGPVEHELVLSKSRFLTSVVPASSPDEAADVVASIRRGAWDASHHCSARITGLRGENAGSSDDGEPSGTAGAPMLEVLRRRDLTDVVAVVTRYFGGVKLGAGGLIRAYSTAVSEALDAAQLVRRVALRQVNVDVPHADAGRIDNVLRAWAAAQGAVLGEPTYAANATFELWVPGDALATLQTELAAASGGTLTLARGSERIVDIPA